MLILSPVTDCRGEKCLKSPILKKNVFYAILFAVSNSSLRFWTNHWVLQWCYVFSLVCEKNISIGILVPIFICSTFLDRIGTLVGVVFLIFVVVFIITGKNVWGKNKQGTCPQRKIFSDTNSTLIFKKFTCLWVFMSLSFVDMDI